MTVEELVLKISGDSKGGEEAANKVGEALKNALESPQGSLARLGTMLADKLVSPMGAAVVGGAALVGTIAGVGMKLYEFAERAADVGAELGDLSEITNIAVGPLSALRAVAITTSTDFQGLTSSVVKMNKGVTEGNSDLQRAVKTLGLSFEEFRDLKPDERLQVLSDKFRNLPPDVDKSTLAMGIFGKSGAEMIPLLNKPLSDLIARSRELGLTWSTEDAEAATRFKEANLELHATIEGMENRIGRALIPTLAKMMTSILGNKQTMDGLAAGGQMLGTVLGFVVQVTGYLVTAFFGVLAAGTQVSSWIIDIKLLFLQAFQTIIDKLASIPGVASVIPGLTAMQAGLRAEVSASKKEWSDNEQSIGKYIAAGGAAYDTSQEVAKALKGLGTAQADATAKTGEHGAATTKLTADQKAAKAAAEALSEAHVTLSAGVKKSAEQLLAHGYTADETFKILKDGGAVTDDAKKAIDRLGEAHKQAADKEKQHQDALRNITASIDDVSVSVRDWILAYNNLGASSADIAKALNVTEAQVKRVVDANNIYKKALAELDEQSRKFLENQKKLMDVNAKGVLDNIKLKLDAEKEADDLQAHRTKDQFEYQRQLIDEWYRDQLAKVDHSKDNWLGATAAITIDYKQKIADITKAHDEALRQMKASEDSWANIFKGTLASIPGMLQDAFTGGGGLSGAFSGIMSKLGQSIGGKGLTTLFNKTAGSLAEHVGMGFTSTLGTLIPGIGAALGSLMGPVISGIGKLFDSMFHNAGREAVKQFAATFQGGFDGPGGMHQALLACGDAGEAMWQKLSSVRDANQAKALIAEATKMIADQKAATEALTQAQNTQFSDLLNDLTGLGAGDLLQPYLDKLTDAKGLTADNLVLVKQLAGDTTVSYDQMKKAAQALGISEDALGQSFQNAKSQADWQSIIDNLDTLVRGGADVNQLLGDEGLQKRIQELVVSSQKFGTTIPENAKPWIQSLIDQGKLLDASGNKITDINKLSFGESLQTSVQKLVDKISALIDKLGAVPGALDKIPNTKTVEVEYHGRRTGQWPEQDGSDGGTPAPAASTGALVTRYGLEALHMAIGGLVRFRPQGSDTVPAMLTPGEIVLNAAQQGRVADALSASTAPVITFEAGAIDASGSMFTDTRAMRQLAGIISDELARKYKQGQRVSTR